MLKISQKLKGVEGTKGMWLYFKKSKLSEVETEETVPVLETVKYIQDNDERNFLTITVIVPTKSEGLRRYIVTEGI